jgi:hypothetical protein
MKKLPKGNFRATFSKKKKNEFWLVDILAHGGLGQK